MSLLFASARRGSNEGAAIPPPLDGDGHHHHHLHLPLHRPHLSVNLTHAPNLHLFQKDADGEYEFAFEEEGASSDSDSDGSESTGASSVGTRKGSGFSGKVKGGVKGAGVAVAHKISDTHLPQRLLLAFVAVMLLWLTSYGIARSIVRAYIVVPSIDEVSDKNYAAYLFSLSEREAYVVCVNNIADNCAETYDEALLVELGKRDAKKSANSALLVGLASDITALELQYNATLLELQAVVLEVDESVTPAFESGSPDETCALLAGIVGGDTGAINALQLASAFEATAQLQVLSLKQQIYARDAYNTQYRIDKTAELRARATSMKDNVHNMTGSFAALAASFGGTKSCMTSGGNCAGGTSANDRLVTMYNASSDRFDVLKDESAAYKAQAAAKLADYQELITKLGDAFDVFGEAGIPVFDYGTPSDADEPTQLDALGTFVFDAVKPSSEVLDGIDGFMDDFEADMAVLQGVFEANATQLAQDADSWDSGWDTGYEPPSVTLSNGTVDNFIADTVGFTGDVSTKLTAFDENSADEQEAASGDVANTTTSLNSTAQSLFVELTNHSNWDFYTYGEDVVSSIDTGISDMSDLILAFDLLFRVVRTVLIIRKYWSLTALATPPGDARIKADFGAGWGPRKTPMQRMASLLLNPVVLTILTTATLSVLLYTFWWAYEPLYDEYVDSCVEANFQDIANGDASGTMLFRNGYQVVFQYASSEGDALAAKRVDDLNVGRDLVCNQEGFDDTVLFNAQVERFNALMERLAETVNQNLVLRECLDLSSVPLLEAQVLDAAYDLDPPLPDPLAIYNCSNVQSCSKIRASSDNPTGEAGVCPGVSQSVLQSVTHSAACTTENWWHGYLFSSFLVVSCFILINISRIITMRGIVRIFWRRIIVKNFSVLISCSDSGYVEVPEAVSEDNKSMKEAIRLALKKAIRKWERWGYILFALGLAINVPWIWALQFFSQSIEYTEQ